MNIWLNVSFPYIKLVPVSSAWWLKANINSYYEMYFFMISNQFDLHKDHNYASLNSNLQYENETTFLYSLCDIVFGQCGD